MIDPLDTELSAVAQQLADSVDAVRGTLQTGGRVPLPEDVAQCARILHDAMALDSDACAECFQHTASQEPCPVCTMLGAALQLMRIDGYREVASADGKLSVLQFLLDERDAAIDSRNTAWVRLSDREQRA